MIRFRVVPIPAAVSTEVRQTSRAPRYGHPAHHEAAKGYGPCRSCLRTFDTSSDRRILFTWNSFEGLDDYPSPGPIFIHENDCAPFDRRDEFPSELRDLPLVLEAYGDARWIRHRAFVSGEAIEAELQQMLGDEEVRFVQVRNREAGCYIARVER